MSGVIPSTDAFRRIADATRFFEQSYRNRVLKGEKRTRFAGGCKARNEIWKFIVGGNPTAGSFTFDLNVLGVTEEISIAFDDTAAEVETALELHTNIADGDVTVIGGPLPNVDITIEFTGALAKHLMEPPTTIDFSGLTGGSGVMVIPVFVRPGHPQDGSVAP